MLEGLLCPKRKCLWVRVFHNSVSKTYQITGFPLLKNEQHSSQPANEMNNNINISQKQCVPISLTHILPKKQTIRGICPLQIPTGK